MIGKAANFLREQARDRWFWICVASVAGLPVLLAFLLRGAPAGFDIGEHIRFAAAYRDTVLNGTFIPVWSARDAYGFGSVGIRLYPPLADYLLGLTQIVTRDWYAALWLDTIFWTFPGCIGIYLLVREFTPTAYAAAAGALYAVMPYHLVQINQFQFYSEFAASAILPFCFLFATRVVRRGTAADTVGLSISCSLLVLTHIPSTMIGLACLGLYVAVILDWRRPVRQVARFAIAAAITIASTAFYVVRLVTEADWVRHSTPEFSTGFYDYGRHFFPLIENFGERYWLRSMSMVDLTIVSTALAFVPLIVCFVMRDRSEAGSVFESKVLTGLLATGAFSMFMLSGLSRFIWEAIPLLQKVQFPWRFMSAATVIATVGLGLAAAELVGRKTRPIGWAVSLMIVLVAGLLAVDYAQTVRAVEPPTREDFYKTVVDKPDDSFCACWWPIWARVEALADREPVAVDNRTVNVAVWEPLEREFSVNAGEPGNARAATFYYPYWKAMVNGAAVEVSKDDNGAILIPIPADKSTISLYFKEPQIDRVALFVSIAAWLALALWLVQTGIRRFGGA